MKKKIRYSIKGVWHDAKSPDFKIQDCEAIEIIETLTQKEFEQHLCNCDCHSPNQTK